MTRALTPDEIVAALRKFGLRYREVSGWRTRSNGRVWGDVTGFMWHHTGDDAPDDHDLDVVTHGYAGLSGPLCNFGLADDGTVFLVAAGPANHAGGGDSRVLAAVRHESYDTAPPAPRFTHADYLNGASGSVLGNRLLYGVECFYYRERNPAQLAAMPRLAAAIIDALDTVDKANTWTAKSAIGHLEWQRGKIDPALPSGWSCHTLRTQTQAILANPTEDDMDATQAKQLAETHAMLRQLTQQIPERWEKPDATDPTGRKWVRASKGEPGARLAPVLDELHGNSLNVNIWAVRDLLTAMPQVQELAAAVAKAVGREGASVTAAEIVAELGRQLSPPEAPSEPTS